MNGRGLMIAAVIAFAAGSAAADYVLLKDGRRFDGKLTLLRDKSVSIDAVVAGIRGEFTFPMNQVAEIGEHPQPENWPEEFIEPPAPKPSEEDVEGALITRTLNQLRAVDRWLEDVNVALEDARAAVQRLQERAQRHPILAQRTQHARPVLSLRIQRLIELQQRYAELRRKLAERIDLKLD